MTTWLQLMEVFYVLLRDGMQESQAREVIGSLQPHLIDFSFEDVLDAMVLRAHMKRQHRNLSYVDAIGYQIAKNRGLRFLTRDPGLRGLPGVQIP